MRGEGGVDCGYQIVLWLLTKVFLLHWVRVVRLHGRHMCLHGEEGASRRRLMVLIKVDTAEVSHVVPVHDVSVWENVGKGAFGSEFAIALCTLSEAVL